MLKIAIVADSSVKRSSNSRRDSNKFHGKLSEVFPFDLVKSLLIKKIATEIVVFVEGPIDPFYLAEIRSRCRRAS